MLVITFWDMLHAARKLKTMGWPMPMRLAFLAGMKTGGYCTGQFDKPVSRARNREKQPVR